MCLLISEVSNRKLPLKFRTKLRPLTFDLYMCVDTVCIDNMYTLMESLYKVTPPPFGQIFPDDPMLLRSEESNRRPELTDNLRR